LRFPEFAGEWEEYILDGIGDTYSGLSGKSAEDFGSGYKYIQYKQVFDSSKIDVELCGLVAINQNESQNKVQYGDVLFTTSSETPEEVGYSSVMLAKEDNVYLNSFCFGYRPSVDIIAPHFSRYIFRSVNMRRKISKLAQGSTRYNISKIGVLKLSVAIPSLLEQKKIAKFLSHLDERIETQNKIIEQYKSLIKGMSEKLFSQQMRFKEFSEIWQISPLGKVLLKNSIKNKNQKYSIVQSVSNKFGFINQSEVFEDRRVASSNTSNYYVIEKGCFAYNPSRINIGSLAYKNDNEISVISPLYVSFKANNDFLADYFLWYWFTTTGFKQQMTNLFEGSVRDTLSYESLIQMQLPVPSIKEQTKIAYFLSKFSSKIEIEKQFLNQLEVQKKYLLQQMFI
jgi:type I restriction enzyme S subunit